MSVTILIAPQLSQRELGFMLKSFWVQFTIVCVCVLGRPLLRSLMFVRKAKSQT
jgi:hypothetical protein